MFNVSEMSRKETMEFQDDVSQSCVRVISFFPLLPYDLFMSATLGIFDPIVIC